MLQEKTVCLFALSLALGATSNVYGEGSTFTRITYPGATSTLAWGINTRGDIVGAFVIGDVTHGFLLSAGQYSTIDFPGATGTQVFTVNPRGDAGGIYTTADKSTHGFLLRDRKSVV